MTPELQKQRDKLAEKQAFTKGNAHTLRTEPAWHYSLIDFKAGFDACHTFMNKDIESLQSKLDVAKKPLEFYANEENSVFGRLSNDDLMLSQTFTSGVFHSSDLPKETVLLIGGKIARQALKEMETTSKGEK